VGLRQHPIVIPSTRARPTDRRDLDQRRSALASLWRPVCKRDLVATLKALEHRVECQLLCILVLAGTRGLCAEHRRQLDLGGMIRRANCAVRKHSPVLAAAESRDDR
jgi:hypothetical protein